MKRVLNITLIIFTCLLFWQCNDSDDITDIFVNRRFKITNVVYNNTPINDITELYIDDSYYIIFNQRTFQGALMSGNNIEGTWDADGSKQSFHMNFGNNTNISKTSDTQEKILNILKNADRYEGDCNVIKIKKGNDAYIQMSSLNVIK